MNPVYKFISLCYVAGFCVMLSTAESSSSLAEDKPTTEKQDAVLDTIAQINHINWVVNTIKTYNNAIVLEEEYEKISQGNLNLNRIPDEETLKRITTTLDTLYSLRKSEREMWHWKNVFRDERMRKIRKYELESARSLYGLFQNGLLGFMTGELGTVLQTACALVHGGLNQQYDYDDFIHRFDRELQEKEFVFDSQKLDLLHNQNKELLDDQWRLVRKYHLDDRTTRVTDVDIKSLLSVLKDGNASRIYIRLTAMKGRYKLFPEFWYYLSCAALETGHFNEGRVACDTFFKVNRGIFRDDPMAGLVALNKAMMLEKDKGNLSELKRCLEIAWSCNQNRNDWPQDFIVASLYDGILHERTRAVDILQHAIAGLESEMSEYKRAGRDISDFRKTLDSYHEFLFRLLPEQPMPAAIRASEFISFPDKLRFLARSKDADVWETLKDDIRSVSMSYGSYADWDFARASEFVDARFPASWVLNDDTSIKIVRLMRGSIEHYRTSPGTNENANTFWVRAISEGTLSALGKAFAESKEETPLTELLPDAKGMLPDAPQIQLSFDSPKYPITLTFARKGMGYRSSDVGYGKRLFLFKFSVFGKEYYWVPESGLDSPSYSPNVTSLQRQDVFTSKYSFTVLSQLHNFVCPDTWVVNGVRLLRISTGKDISIEYRNETLNKFRPCVTFVFVNEYGMLIHESSDTFYNRYTSSKREISGGFFMNERYEDRQYQYMSPGETRTFSTTMPAKTQYVLVLVSSNYTLTETTREW